MYEAKDAEARVDMEQLVKGQSSQPSDPPTKAVMSLRDRLRSYETRDAEAAIDMKKVVLRDRFDPSPLPVVA